MSNEICGACGKARKDVKQLVSLSRGHFMACNECIELAADLCGISREGRKAKSSAAVDLQDIKLPTTTKEFAQWLRDVAEQIDRIPDRPLVLRPDDVEVGFYYGHPTFPQKPTGLHFAVDFASTELTELAERHR